MKKIAIIPAYNESESLLGTIADLRENAPDFDYIIINDCSTDCSEELCRSHHLNAVHLPVNLGIGGAVQTGYRYALEHGYDLAVQFDGDGQHSAAYLEEMSDYLISHGCSMVIGSRFIKKEGFQSSGIRRLGIRYFSALIRILTGKRITDPTSGMRLADRSVIQIFARDYPKDYPEPESVVTLLKKGLRVEELPVIMKERTAGVSSIAPLKSVYYMVKVSIAVLFACIRH